MIRAFLLAMTFLLSFSPGLLLAAAPEGTWVYDRASLESQGDKFAELMMHKRPVDVEKTRANADKLDQDATALEASDPERARKMHAAAAGMRDVANDPKSYFRRAFIQMIAGKSDNTVTLAPRGKVIVASDGKVENGTWKIEGKEVVISFKDNAVRGSFSAKRLELRYGKTPPSDAETTAFLKDFRWVMVPR